MTQTDHIDLDQFPCLYDKQDWLADQIKKAVDSGDSEVRIRTKRNIEIRQLDIMIPCNVIDDDCPHAHIYINNRDLNRDGSRFVRLKAKNGFLIRYIAKKHTISLSTWKLKQLVIVGAEAVLESSKELVNPTANATLRIKVCVVDPDKFHCKHLVATLQDGVLMWKGAPLDACNRDKVEADLAELIAQSVGT